MNPLEKEIARQNPINTDAPLTFTEKELLALLDECVQFEVALRGRQEFDDGYAEGLLDAECECEWTAA